MVFGLQLERSTEAPPDIVFELYLRLHGPDRPQWIVDSDLESFRVGGTWSLVFRPPGREPFRETRVFSRIDPPHDLAWSVADSDDPGGRHTEVELTFLAEDSGTRVTLSQSGFPTAEIRDEYRAGWTGVLDAVEDLALGGQQ